MLSLFAKLRNKYFQQFIRMWGREPQTPKEWMDIQDLAVRELNKTKGVPPGPQKPPFQGWTPKVIPGGKGIESLIKSGDVKKGVAPKTTKETLKAKKDKHILLRDSEEGIARIKRENKQAIKDFKKKHGKKTVEDFRDEGDFDPGGMASGGRIGMMIGGFTKAKVLIQMLENTLKGSKDAYVKKTFPNFIKELKANPELANNENVWKNLTTGLPKNQRLIVHSDDSVDFFTQTEFGPHNIERTLEFQKKHNLSRDQANTILRMEPEDRVLEMKRLETIRNKTMQAQGGRVPLMYGGDPGFQFEYGGSWADWRDQHQHQMPVTDYIKTKMPKERLPFRNSAAGGGIIKLLKKLLKKKPKKDVIKPFEFPEVGIGSDFQKKVLDDMLKSKSRLKDFEPKGKPHASGGLAYMLGEPTYMKMANGGDVFDKLRTREAPPPEKGDFIEKEPSDFDPHLEDLTDLLKREKDKGKLKKLPYDYDEDDLNWWEYPYNDDPLEVGPYAEQWVAHGGSVGHAPWHKPTAQPQPQPQLDTPAPQVGGAQSPGRGQPNPMKAPRGLPSAAPRTMDPAVMQQQMMQRAMMGQGQQRGQPRMGAAEGSLIETDPDFGKTREEIIAEAGLDSGPSVLDFIRPRASGTRTQETVGPDVEKKTGILNIGADVKLDLPKDFYLKGGYDKDRVTEDIYFEGEKVLENVPFDHDIFTVGGGYEGDGFQAKVVYNPDAERYDFKLVKSFNQGGRIGFGLGGIDKGRRAFMKWLAGLTGAGIAAGSGLLKFGKAAKVAPKVTETIVQSNAAGMPVWFPKLVQRVIKEGEDISQGAATIERQTVHRATTPEGTPIEVTRDLTSGDVIVDIGEQTKHGWSHGRHGQPVRLELKKGEWIEPSTTGGGYMTKGGDNVYPGMSKGALETEKTAGKGIKTKDEFTVQEAEFTGGHPENVKFEETVDFRYGDHGSDFSEVEKYAIGKNKDKKIIGKQADKDAWAEGRAESQADEYDKMRDEGYFDEAEKDFYEGKASGGLAYALGE